MVEGGIHQSHAKHYWLGWKWKECKEEWIHKNIWISLKQDLTNCVDMLFMRYCRETAFQGNIVRLFQNNKDLACPLWLNLKHNARVGYRGQPEWTSTGNVEAENSFVWIFVVFSCQNLDTLSALDRLCLKLNDCIVLQ